MFYLNNQINSTFYYRLNLNFKTKTLNKIVYHLDINKILKNNNFR